MGNYIRNNVKEFPYEGVFYRIGYDETLPPSQQVETEIVLLSTMCNIQEAGSSLKQEFINASFKIFFPIVCAEKFPFNKGDRFKSNVCGLEVKGEVIGIFPSQLGKVQVYIKDFDAE